MIRWPWPETLAAPAPTLRLPPRLVEALARLEGGPLDSGHLVQRIAAGVSRLNRGLTRERAGFGAYLRDPELRAAYRAYYLATNAPKLWPVLDRLEARGRLPAGGGRVLELGCGPGTGVAALALWAAERGETWHLTATDALREATQAAAALFAALDWPLETAVLDLRPPAIGAGSSELVGPFDLVLCLNVINELSAAGDAALLDRVRAWLAPGGCLVALEPASAVESRRILSLRDRAVARGWHVIAPCPGNEPCPALASADGWCHGEWHFERPAYVQAVDRAIGLRREVLKATWFVLSPTPVAPIVARGPVSAAERQVARVMGARTGAKGRSEIESCADGAVRRLELQIRDRNPGNADVFDLSRHDLALIEGPGARDRTDRRLGAEDTVTRVEEVE